MIAGEPSLAIVTIANDIEPARLSRIIRTWDVPGVDMIVVVRGAGQEVAIGQLKVPLFRQVIPAPNVPFSRATWRNIGLRFAQLSPPHNVFFIDADCALVRPEAVFDIKAALAGTERRLVVVPPAWSTQEAASRFLLASCAKDALAALEGVSAKRPDAAHAGTCALSASLAIEVSWDDNLDQGWGYEDDDFCRRALLHAEQDAPVHVEGLVHVWHPPRGRSRQSKVRNRQIALARGKAPVWCRDAEAVTYLRAQWYTRAEREIAHCKLPFSVFQAVVALPDGATEVDVRRLVASQLRSGALPVGESYLYGPVLGATLIDRSS